MLQETRPQTIAHHVRLALGQGLTMRRYAADVAEIYTQRTAVSVRTIAFHATADIYADERANAQIVKRYLDGESGYRMPCEIEESLVLALPDPYRSECRRELAARYGELAAPMPAADAGAEQADAGRLMEHCGSALVELAQIWRDGRVTADELAMAKHAADKLTAIIAQCVSLRHRLSVKVEPNVTPMRMTK